MESIFCYLKKNMKQAKQIQVSEMLCFKYLEKLNLIWRFHFRIKPIFATAQAATKKYFSLQKLLKKYWCVYQSNVQITDTLFMSLFQR